MSRRARFSTHIGLLLMVCIWVLLLPATSFSIDPDSDDPLSAAETPLTDSSTSTTDSSVATTSQNPTSNPAAVHVAPATTQAERTTQAGHNSNPTHDTSAVPDFTAQTAYTMSLELGTEHGSTDEPSPQDSPVMQNQDMLYSRWEDHCAFNMMILLDASNSISANDFEAMKDFARQVISEFSIGPDAGHIGIMQFAGKYQCRFEEDPLGCEIFRTEHISPTHDIKALNRFIDNMRQIGAGQAEPNTDIVTALQTALPLIDYQRAWKNSVFVIVTDGRFNGDNYPRYVLDMHNVHHDFKEVIGVPVGSNIDTVALEDMSNVVTAGIHDVDTLVELVESGFRYGVYTCPPIKIEHIEWTQAIQDQGNNVPLVADKSTLIRVYLGLDCDETSNNPTCERGLAARVTGYLDGPVQGRRADYPREVDVGEAGSWEDHRVDIDKTLNFSFAQDDPAWIQAGTRTYRLRVVQIVPVPYETVDVEIEILNEPITLHYYHQPSLRLMLVPITRHGISPPMKWSVDIAHTTLSDILPVSTVEILPYRQVISQDDQSVDPYEDVALDWKIAMMSMMSTLDDVESAPYRAIGVLHENSTTVTHNGWYDRVSGAIIVKDRLGMGFTLAHELGHAYGLNHAHVPGGGSVPDCWYTDGDVPPAGSSTWPYQDSTIQDYGVLMLHFGPPLLISPERNYDIMASCAPRWVSPSTYVRFFSQLQALSELSHVPLEADGSSDYFMIRGLIATDDTAEFYPTWVTVTRQPFAPNTGTDYCVEAQDAVGTSLAQHCFDLSFTLPETNEPTDVDGFFLTLPYSGDVTRIVLKKGEVELAVQAVSRSAPVVTVTTPNGGETWDADETQTITWTASDADSDPLRYSVLYSPDGDSFQPLTVDISETEVTVETANLPGGDAAQVRVMVTDGVNTASDESDAPFTVAHKPPAVEVSSPEDGLRVMRGIPVTLQGFAFDVEDGMLPDAGLVWTSDLDGELGVGEVALIETLTVGQHIITLAATDSDDNRTAVSRTVEVVEQTPPDVAPTLLSPVNKATVMLADAVLTWEAVERGTSYQVQIDDTPDFSSPEADQIVDRLRHRPNVPTFITYHWRVRAVNDAGAGPWSDAWQLNLVDARAPVNDDFDSAIVIDSLPFTDAQDTQVTFSTPDDPSPSCATDVAGSVWYTYTPSTDSVLRLDSESPDLREVVSVWTGARGDLTQVVCSSGTGLPRSVELSADTTYHIMVGGHSGGTGDLFFSAADITPVNDDFDNAIVIDSLPFTDARDTRWTVLAGDDPSDGGEDLRGTIWYAYTPPVDGEIRLNAADQGHNVGALLSLWTGTRGNLSRVAVTCTEPYCPLDSDPHVSVTAGTTYYIMARLYGCFANDDPCLGQEGYMEFLAADVTSDAPFNDAFDDAIVIDSLPFNDVRDTRLTTPDPDDPVPSCGINVRGTVWYQHTASTDSILRLDTEGSDLDTVVSVWTGARDNLTQVSCGFSLLDIEVTAGTVYYIMIGGNTYGKGTLHLTVPDLSPFAPINDDFDNAIVIDSLPFSDARDTRLTVPADDDPDDGGGQPQATIWYAYTPPADSIFHMDTVGSDYQTRVSVWTGERGNLTQVTKTVLDNSEMSTGWYVELSTGTTYFIMVRGYDFLGGRDLEGFITFAAEDTTARVPTNDDFDDAIAIDNLPFSDAQDTSLTVTASDDPSPPCYENVRGSIWYTYTAEADRIVRLSTPGSSVPTVLAVWTGERNNLTPVACDTDIGTMETSSVIYLETRAGTTYHIMIAGSRLESSYYHLNSPYRPNSNMAFSATDVTSLVPADDDFDNAFAIDSLPFDDVQDTRVTYADDDDPNPTCDPDVGATVWYTYTAPADSIIRLRTEDSSFNASLSVWTGARGNLAQVACQSTSESPVDLEVETGTTYHIMIGGHDGAAGHLRFSVTDVAWRVPANDDFDNAIVIHSLPFADAQDTRVTFTPADDPTDCGANVRNTVWYTYTAPAHGVVRLSTAGSNFYTVLSVWTGERGDLTQVACERDLEGDGSMLDLEVAAGTIYYIMIGGSQSTHGNLSFSATDVTSLIPPNDDFDNAIVIDSLPFADAQDTRVTYAATDDPDPTCHGTQATVWYTYTASADSIIRMRTVDSSFNAPLSVWTGARGDLIQVACGAVVLDLEVEAGVVYHILVNGAGDLRFSATDATLLVPVNDDFDSALTIDDLPFLDTQDTRVTFNGSDDPIPPCGSSVAGTVWYAYTAPNDIVLRLSTAVSGFDTVLSVWTGARGSLVPVACDDQSGAGKSSLLDLKVAVGKTYYIMAGGDWGTTGDIHLSVAVATQLVPENDDFEHVIAVDRLPFVDVKDTRVAFTGGDDPVPSCGSDLGNTIWYTYAAPDHRILRLSTAGSDFDTVLSVWIGARGSLVPVACDDQSGAGISSLLDLEVTADTTYHIMIGGDRGASGTLSFSATDTTSLTPVNDDFEHAIVVDSLPLVDERDTRVAFTAVDDPVPSCGSDLGNTIWYTYTDPDHRILRLSTAGSDFDTVLSVWTGARESLTAIACDDRSGIGNTSRLDLEVIPGTTYHLMIGGDRGSSGSLSFSAADVAALTPVNDDFDDAIAVGSLPFRDARDAGLAGSSLDDPVPACGSNVGATVWYSYTTPADRVVRLSTLGSDFDTVLSAWTGKRGSLTQVACDDQSGYGSSSQLELEAQTGVTYYIMVVGDRGSSGDLRFSVVDMAPLAPANDDFDNAIVIDSVPFTDAQDTRVTFAASDDPIPTCGINVGATVWYTHIASADGIMRLSTAGSDFDTVLSVWMGAHGDLIPIACDDQSGYGSSSLLDLEMTVGTTYHLMIGGDRGTSGGLSFSATDVTSLTSANDDFDTPVAIDSLPFFDARDTRVSFTASDDPVSSCGSNVSGTVWYTYTPFTSRILHLSTEGSDFDTIVSVWTGERGNLTQVACDDQSGYGSSSQLDLEMIAGTTYAIIVGGDRGGSGILSLSARDVTWPLVPANDDFDDAIAIDSLPFNDAQDTRVTFTPDDDPTPDCGANVRNTVWYTYTAPADGIVRLRTEGSDFDTILSVWTGARGALTQVACDDRSGMGTASLIDLEVTPGTTYHIMIGGDQGRSGDLSFSAVDLTPLVPVNDDFDNAIVIDSLPFDDTRDTRVTFTSPDDPPPGCGANVHNTVWYTYTAPDDGLVRLSTEGSWFHTVLSVWTGERGNLIPIACDDYSGPNYSSLLDLDVTADTTYHMMVGGNEGSTGDLHFSATNLTPVNDDFDNAIVIDSLPFSDMRDTRLSVPADDDPDDGGGDPRRTVWYTYTATADGVLRLSDEGSGFDTIISLWTGERGDLDLVAVACSDLWCPVSRRPFARVTAGTTYHIMVRGIWCWEYCIDIGGILVFSLTDVTPQVPPNDDVDDAIVIDSLPFVVQSDAPIAFGAADDPTPSCGPDVTETVWYAYTAPDDKILRLRTDRAGTALSVFTGERGSLTQITCHAQGAPVDVEMMAGTTYYIMHGGPYGGNFDLFFEAIDVTALVPANDDFDAAIAIDDLPFVDTQDTRVSFTGADDPMPSCAPPYVDDTVWYTYTAPADGIVRLSTAGSSFGTVLSVWTGERGDLTQVACDAQSGIGTASLIDLEIATDTTYHITAGGVWGNAGELIFSANQF
jgi:hypothetical protein